jgi:hypothetical protein
MAKKTTKASASLAPRKTLSRREVLAQLSRRKTETPERRGGPVRPLAAAKSAVRLMNAHRFHAGQTVTLLPNRYGPNRNGSFEVTRLLPAEHGVNHYRLKSVADGHERVAAEDELS